MDLLFAIFEWLWPSGDERQRRWERVGCALGLCVLIAGLAVVILFSLRGS